MEQNSPRGDAVSTDGSTQDPPVAPELAEAVRAVERMPDKDDTWDELEALAGTHQRPDEVAALYRRIIGGQIPPELASHLGQRAARFHDEWFEDPAPLVLTLTRVLEVDPGADWAFHRLSLLFTHSERWADLLSLYDRALAGTTDSARRMQLLDEAAHVAKDFSGQPDRAIHYLEQLFPLKPSDAQLATSLERLFEKQGRYHDLINLWTARLAVLGYDAAQATRARIAACWLDHLADPAKSLAAVEVLIADASDDTVACGLLERIAALPASTPEVRRRALELLKGRYAAKKRSSDVVRILEIGLRFAEAGERAGVHREIAERLVEQGKDAEAIEHSAALVVLEPTDAKARENLRALADRTGRHDRYADALAAAAETGSDSNVRTPLLVEAADVRCDTLNDAPGAIGLYARVMAAPEAEPETLLRVARRLTELLHEAGRSHEELDVLERLATLEPLPEAQKSVLGTAARLSDKLGDTDRALVSWQHRLDNEAADLDALDAMVDLLDRAQRWEKLIEVLRRRTVASTAADSQRTDFVRIARLYSDQLNAIEPAIQTWTQVREQFGQDAETVDALADLYTTSERWGELAKLLERAAEHETESSRRAQLLHRLGDTYRERLASSVLAAECYRNALGADPRNEGSRAGMLALLRDDQCVSIAVDTLAKAYGATDEWNLTLEILDARLGVAADREVSTLLLLEAAQIQEQRAQDLPAALASVRRAFPLAPGDKSIESELIRLARATDGWPLAVAAYRDAIGACRNDTAREADLGFELAGILETRISDQPSALEAYTRVTALQPDRLEASESVIRVAANIGSWDAAAAALVDSARTLARIERVLFSDIERVASETSAWNEATVALATAIAGSTELAAGVARDLETQVALWHRDRREDLDAAELALLRAVGHDGSNAPTLGMLAALQRRAPGRPLVVTLLRLADAVPDDLDPLHEAAEIGSSVLSDPDLTRGILSRLLEAASHRWRNGVEQQGARSSGWYASWALEQLVQLCVNAGEHSRAVDLLVEASELPFDPKTSRAMRHRAAEIAANQLSDGERAIELYRAILAEATDDTRAIRQLALLYETHSRLPDLLKLRKHELKLTTAVDRRLEIRLEMARIQGSLGKRDARVKTLRENLNEQAGHPASVAEISAVLDAESNHAELADVLADQAARLDADGQTGDAATLWARVADLAERRLDNVERALESLRRVVASGPTLEALDTLARLHVARGEHASAVGWLEKRLEMSEFEARPDTVVRLANAHIGAGQRDRALVVLESALEADASAGHVRDLLAAQYRAAGTWAPLAALLTAGTDHVSDPATKLAYLREAAEIYHRRLDTPDTAIPILESAALLAPTDRIVRTALADALRAAGRLDEARTILQGLIEEFGRRRPPERAAVHFQIAQIAKARGDVTDAMAQLELAAGIDMAHAGILRMLGDLARDGGQLERAERAYRALLLIVRRQTPEAEAAHQAGGPSEIHFELYRIAVRLGQADRAREILESAFEMAGHSDAESKRFERMLRGAGDPELLLRALQNRLARAQDPSAVADTLTDLADVLTDLNRLDEAFDARLRALGETPGAASLHDATRALAVRAGRIEQYAEKLQEMANRAREERDMGVAGDLYVRLGDIAEKDLGKLDRAAEFYAHAEATGEHNVDVWRALDRVYGALKNTEGQIRVLRLFVSPDTEISDANEKTDALYRLAEMELAGEETREGGVEMLSWAVDRDPQYDRAARMLRTAADAAPDNARVVAIYERVARASGDETLLLDSLERSAALPDATADMIREAVDLGTRLEKPERAEALLRRAIEVARAANGLADVVWALVALAERRKAAGDLTGAIASLREAADVAEPAESHALLVEVAALAAGPVGDLELAATMYEKLRERDPSDRTVWEPLLDIYRNLGQDERLEDLIASTVDSVFDSGERNRLRMERARLLLGKRDRLDDAVTTLRDILEEDPDDVNAAQMLIDVYERTGRADELSELLTKQFDAARDRQDAATVTNIALRLAAILAPTRRDEALEVYKTALRSIPDNRELLQALLAMYRPEDDVNDRADAMERLLALEKGAKGASLAFELVTLREGLEDDAGVQRALDLGFRASPSNETIRLRLEKWYTDRQDYAHLADMLAFDAATRKDPDEAVARFREAAALQRDKLSNYAAAAEVLRQASVVAPDDSRLLTEMVANLAQAGEHATAVSEVGRAIEAHPYSPRERAELLRMRAELHAALEQDVESTTDLEEAFTLGGEGFAEALVVGLDRQRTRAADKGQKDVERAATLRLSELLASRGDAERSRDLIAEWVARETDDRDALHTLVAMDTAAERWDSVVESCGRLVEVEEGDRQIDAAIKMASAAEKAGRPGAARDGLERVYREHESNEQVRAQLKKLYQASGANRELADMLLNELALATDDATRFERLKAVGELLLRGAGDAAGASEPLAAALKLKPSDHETLIMLADAYTGSERIAEATAMLDAAITAHKGRRSKELAVLQHRMARVALAAGDRTIELAWLNAALDCDMQNGAVASELAEVAMELAQTEAALKALRAITLMKHPGPMTRAMAFLKQGQIAFQQGDQRRAVFLAKKAHAEDPHLADVGVFLKEIGAE